MEMNTTIRREPGAGTQSRYGTPALCEGGLQAIAAREQALIERCVKLRVTALFGEGVKRGVPMAELIRQALLTLARKINGYGNDNHKEAA